MRSRGDWRHFSTFDNLTSCTSILFLQAFGRLFSLISVFFPPFVYQYGLDPVVFTPIYPFHSGTPLSFPQFHHNVYKAPPLVSVSKVVNNVEARRMRADSQHRPTHRAQHEKNMYTHRCTFPFMDLL